jgi:hypothetical protein
MHICFKIIKFLLHSTLLYMFRTPLHMQPLVTVWCCFGCVLQPCCCYRTGLDDATNTTPHGNQRLHVQWWKAPDDGHSGVRNM